MDAGLIVIKVAVVERSILGIKGWFARCLECDWEGIGRPSEKKAAHDAREHGVHHAKDDKNDAAPV